jgi:hypothetical protein
MTTMTLTDADKLRLARAARLLFLALWAYGLISILAGWGDPSMAETVFLAVGVFMSNATVEHYRRQDADQ